MFLYVFFFGFDPFQKRVALIKREHGPQMAFCDVISDSLFFVQRIQKFFGQNFFGQKFFVQKIFVHRITILIYFFVIMLFYKQSIYSSILLHTGERCSFECRDYFVVISFRTLFIQCFQVLCLRNRGVSAFRFCNFAHYIHRSE